MDSAVRALGALLALNAIMALNWDNVCDLVVSYL
jgi:hypothetical protein